MILNPMYKTADCTKRYCICGVNVGFLPGSDYLASFDGTAFDIRLFEDDYKDKLPPYERLTCGQFMVQGVIPAREGGAYNVELMYGIYPTDNAGNYMLEVKHYSEAVNHMVCDSASFSLDSDHFSIQRETIDNGGDGQLGLIHIHIVPPMEEALNNLSIHNGLATHAIPTSQVDPQYYGVYSIIMDVKCYKDA